MSVPVINIAQMREWENATWATGQAQAEVIRRVGKKIAKHARRLTAADDLILILAGKGSNGADARAAAEHLERRRVELLDVIEPENVLTRLETLLQQKPALIIDGLFGIGLDRPLDDAWKYFIAAVNASKIPVLAVDVPSGLNADTGEPQGAAINAAVTLTVGAPKFGLLLQGSVPHVGQLEVLDNVGLIPCPFTSELNWTLPEDFADFPPRRQITAHKGSFGHLTVVAGSFGYHGAAVLAVRGAQRAQPGLVTLFTQEDVFHPVAAQLQSAMVRVWKTDEKLPLNTTAVLAGPGLAAPTAPDDMRSLVRRFWRDLPAPMIVDASGLDMLAMHSLSRDTIRVVTPHAGEAARMLNIPVASIQSSRVRTLREISRRYGNCWVVLKGHQTLVGRNEGEIFVNPTGNPHLAQGGSGDLLAGYLAGLLAQPALQMDPGRAIRYAVWQHGAAADKLQAGRANWTVEDLADEIGNVR
jgi:NAD(P)H-hydrate epimerase